MALNKLTTEFTGQSGISPRLARLASTESFNEIVTPGFLNGLNTTGYDLQTSDIVFVSYDRGANLGIFVVEKDGDLLSLKPYDPGDNSFAFENTWFFAKGGSDQNSGNQIGFPKQTIGAAIIASAPSVSKTVLIVGLDGNTYDESVLLPFNVTLWMPGATINGGSLDAVVINDAGVETASSIDAYSIKSSSARSLEVNGPLSSLYINRSISMEGDIYNEGILHLKTNKLVDSNVQTQAGSTTYFDVESSLNTSYSLGGDVFGTIIHPDGTRDFYGDSNFVDKLTYNYEVKNETTGFQIDESYQTSAVVYNNAFQSVFFLPQTSNAAIPIGSLVIFVQLGLGAILLGAGPGATIISSEGSPVLTNGAASVANALKISDTVWVVYGDITASP